MFYRDICSRFPSKIVYRCMKVCVLSRTAKNCTNSSLINDTCPKSLESFACTTNESLSIPPRLRSWNQPHPTVKKDRYSQLDTAATSPFRFRKFLHAHPILIYLTIDHQYQIIKSWMRGVLRRAPDNKICQKANEKILTVLNRRIIPFKMTCDSQDSSFAGVAIPDRVTRSEDGIVYCDSIQTIDDEQLEEWDSRRWISQEKDTGKDTSSFSVLTSAYVITPSWAVQRTKQVTRSINARDNANLKRWQCRSFDLFPDRVNSRRSQRKV